MLRLRYHELWLRVKERLSTPRMLSLLQGGKVYLEGENYSQPEVADETKVWGRLVLVPTSTLWPEDPGIGPMRRLGFLTRAEVHSNNDPAYFPQQTLDAIQDEVLVQLREYVVPKQKYIMGARAIWQHRPPQPLPLWDDIRGLWFTSSEYRLEVAPGRGEIGSVVLSQDNVIFSGDPIVFLDVGPVVQLYARGLVADGTLVSGLITTWGPSLDPTIATISSTGLLARLKKGIARIPVTIEGITSTILMMIGEFGLFLEGENGATGRPTLTTRNKDLSTWTKIAGATVTPGQPLRRSSFACRVGNAAQTSAVEQIIQVGTVNKVVYAVAYLWKKDTAVGTRFIRLRSTTQGVNKAQLEWESDAQGNPINLRCTFGQGGGAMELADGYWCMYAYSRDIIYTDVHTTRFNCPAGFDMIALPMVHWGRNPMWPMVNDTDASLSKIGDTFFRGNLVAPYGLPGEFFTQPFLGTFGKKFMLMLPEDSGGYGLSGISAFISHMKDGGDFFGNYDTYTSLGLPWNFSKWSTGALIVGVRLGMLDRGRRTAYVHRADGVNQHQYVGGQLNSGDQPLVGAGVMSDVNYIAATSGNWLLFSIATFPTDIGDAEALAADASGSVIWPVGSSKLFDFTKGKLPDGWKHSRGSIALDDEFSEVAIGIPRWHRVPSSFPTITWLNENYNTPTNDYTRNLAVIATWQLVVNAFDFGILVVGPDIRYETQDPNIVTVSPTGLLTGVAPGTCYIHAWYKTACIYLKVTVV